VKSFLAEYPNNTVKQIIVDGDFLVTIHDLNPVIADSEYTKLLSRERGKKAEITHLTEERSIVRSIKYKALRKYFGRIKILGIPVNLE